MLLMVNRCNKTSEHHGSKRYSTACSSKAALHFSSSNHSEKKRFFLYRHVPKIPGAKGIKFAYICIYVHIYLFLTRSTSDYLRSSKTGPRNS